MEYPAEEVVSQMKQADGSKYPVDTVSRMMQLYECACTGQAPSSGLHADESQMPLPPRGYGDPPSDALCAAGGIDEKRRKELRNAKLFNVAGEVLDQQAIQRILVKSKEEVLLHLRYQDGATPPQEEIDTLCQIYLFADAVRPGTRASDAGNTAADDDVLFVSGPAMDHRGHIH